MFKLSIPTSEKRIIIKRMCVCIKQWSLSDGLFGLVWFLCLMAYQPL